MSRQVHQNQILLQQLLKGKSLVWNGLLNELLIKYAAKLKAPIVSIFQEVWNTCIINKSWQNGLKILFPNFPSQPKSMTIDCIDGQ